jgi:hypothetical protein
MANETKPPSSQELLVQMFPQLSTEIAHARADVSAHVLGLYEFLMRLGFVTRKGVHDYLRHRQIRVDDSAQKAAVKWQLNAMIDMFRDDAPQDPRVRLQLIRGDKSD